MKTATVVALCGLAFASQPPTLQVAFDQKDQCYYITNLVMGSNNQTIKLEPTLLRESTMIVGSDCQYCRYHSFNQSTSETFKYLSDQVFTVLTQPEGTTITRYVQGRFAEDLLTISNQTSFTRDNKSQFFQISNLTNAQNDISMVYEIQGDGWLGLADGVFGQDLVRRGLIKNGSLAIRKLGNQKYDIQYGVFIGKNPPVIDIDQKYNQDAWAATLTNMSFFNTFNTSLILGTLVFDAFATKNILRTSRLEIFWRLQSELLNLANKLSWDGDDIGLLITDEFVDRQASYMLFPNRTCEQVNKAFIKNINQGQNLDFVISVNNYTMKFQAADFLKPHFVKEIQDNCILNLQIEYYNTSFFPDDWVEVYELTLGETLFTRYEELHLSFDLSSATLIPILPPGPASQSLPAWAIVLIVLASLIVLAGIGSIIFLEYRGKRLKGQMKAYGRLSGEALSTIK